MKPKPCKICGEMFIPEKPSNTICKRDHFIPCPICKSTMLWNSTRSPEPCSKECRKERTRLNNLAKYGVEHPMQSKLVQAHHKQSMKEKYGVESPLQSQEIRKKAMITNKEKFGTDWALGNKDIRHKSAETMLERYGAKTTLESTVLRNKVEQTCLEKYGVTNPAQNSDVHNKITNTTFLRYGTYNVMQVPEIMEKSHQSRIDNNGEYWTDAMDQKSKQTSTEHYGFDNPSKSPEIQEKIKQSMIEKYGEGYGAYLTRNASTEIISGINKAFNTKLAEANLHGQFEFAEIKPYRYDIVLPDKKIVFEINPSYTHNAYGNHWNREGTPADYHLKKTQAAKEAGFQCIHVFDWDDWDKIIDIVADKKPVYARNCTMYKLQPKVTDDFLKKYHIQGTVKNQVLCLGLIKDGELLQVMTFGTPRYNKNYSSELLRLCTKPGIALVGGAERMFKFAIDILGVDDVISYCDISKFSGKVYERIGMKFERFTEPQEIWSRGDKKVTANMLRRYGYDQLFGTNYGKGTSNNELMIRDGWLPVYDCGQAVYTYSSSSFSRT